MRVKVRFQNNISNQNRSLIAFANFFGALFLVYYFNEFLAGKFPLALVFWSVMTLNTLYFFKYTALWIAFALYILLIMTYIFGYITTPTELRLDTLTPLVFGPVCAFTISRFMMHGFGYNFGKYHFWDRPSVLALILLFVGCLVIVLLVLTNRNVHDDIRDISGFSYLTTSDMIAAFFIVLCGLNASSAIKFLMLAGFGLLAIALIGSRSALLIYIIVISFIFFQGKSLYFIVRVLGVGVSLGCLVYIAVPSSFEILEPLFERSSRRLMAILMGSSDVSFLEREMLRLNYIDRLVSDPWCFLKPCPPIATGYVHNWLSVIQFFGGLAYPLMMLIIGSWIVMFRKREFNFVTPLMIFCSLSLVLSRAWVHVVFPIAIGISVGLIWFYLARRSEKKRAVA